MLSMRQLLTTLLVLNILLLAAQPVAPKQGYVKKTGPDGKRLYEGEFKDDKPVGRFKYYYPNDSVRAIMDFRNGGTASFARLFHMNGKRMAIGKYINKETKDSTWTYFDEAGVLISRDNYKNGKKEGICYVYLPDGKIAEERHYKNGLQNGEFKEFFGEGSLRSKGQYVNDNLEGRVIYYFPNGVEVASGFYKNGHKHGPWIYKNENNTIREKELYKNGSLANEKETKEFFSKNKTETANKNNKTGNSPNTAVKGTPNKK